MVMEEAPALLRLAPARVKLVEDQVAAALQTGPSL
jgi:hypothetical protein